MPRQWPVLTERVAQILYETAAVAADQIVLANGELPLTWRAMDEDTKQVWRLHAAAFIVRCVAWRPGLDDNDFRRAHPKLEIEL